jgi:hypothetical protein
MEVPMSSISLFVMTIAASLALGAPAQAEVFLPGTQPKENDIRISKVKLCKTCHTKTGDENSEPYKTWQGGMMAQASRDPVYLAAQTIANQDIPGVGEYCIRCHSSSGWFEGRSTKPDGSGLLEHDKNGVACTICHRLVDPLIEEGKSLVETPAPGYGNGMMVMTDNDTLFGPYTDSPPVMTHKTAKSDFLASSELCGTCHDVSNPLAANNIKTDPPSSYGIIERTYSEWLLSDYSKGPDKRTCQSCHFPIIEGGGKAARHKDSPHRDYMVQHGPVGGSIWVQKAIIEIYGKKVVDADALMQGIEKTKAFLKTAAQLDLSFPKSGSVNLRVTNLTGHKLPTGYTEGRRMWVNMKFLDAQGKIIKEIGEYKQIETEISGIKITPRSLTDASDTRVYECLPGLSDEQARKYNKKPGKSFHFVLNDIIIRDTRIPPKGFNNAAFAERGCTPVGIDYADGQYWDDITFALPENCSLVEASLIYEPVTMEYIKFLAEENRTDDQGKTLLNVWLNAGDTTAAVIATVTASP